jgi:hypothetical protein
MGFKILCATLAIPAIAAAVGLHIHGGLAAIGDIEATYTWEPLPFVFKDSEPLGNSYYVGGGVDIPLWRYASAVSPEFSLATDVGFTSKTKQLEHAELLDFELSWKTVAIRGSFVFGVGVGPATPFVGFGGGVAVVPWAFTHNPTGAEIDSQTEIKAAFGIPFGCEFGISPRFGLGLHAEYLIITGDVTPETEIQNLDIAMPDPFIIGAKARINL